MRTQEVEDLFDAPPPPGRARRFIIAFLALAAVGVIAAVAATSRSRSDALAELRVRDGGVSFTRLSEVSAAMEGEDLRSGDRVSTDGSGRAQIDFFDGSLTRLDSDTEITLRAVERSDAGNTISIALGAGRSWNSVSDLGSSDRYLVDVGSAVVSVEGTTFLTDCTDRPTCYVVGFEGDAEVESDTGRSADVGPGDCITVDESGRLEDCDEKKLGLIDEWVRENLAEDQQITLDRVATDSPSPTPSPTAQRTFSPQAPRPVRTPAPTVAPTATPRMETASPDPTTKPRRTKRPTPKPTSEPDRTPRPTESPFG